MVKTANNKAISQRKHINLLRNFVNPLNNNVDLLNNIDNTSNIIVISQSNHTNLLRNNVNLSNNVSSYNNNALLLNVSSKSANLSWTIKFQIQIILLTYNLMQNLHILFLRRNLFLNKYRSFTFTIISSDHKL